MGWSKWLVYILSFFVPIFGFITFWVFSARNDELHIVAEKALICSFFGVILLIILIALGITVFEIPMMIPGV